MKKILFPLFLSTLALWGCKEENNPTIVPPEPPVKPVYVPIFYPGDTTSGAAYAKKLTASFKAQATCRYNTNVHPKDLYITLNTFTKIGEPRENILFADLKYEVPATYPLIRNLGLNRRKSFVRSNYYISSHDGDVLEDRYHLDTTATDNQLTVTKLDFVAKRIEGTFTVSYIVDEIHRNELNPAKVKFANGRFWAKIPD
jgi:hypothetical protein